MAVCAVGGCAVVSVCLQLWSCGGQDSGWRVFGQRGAGGLMSAWLALGLVVSAYGCVYVAHRLRPSSLQELFLGLSVGSLIGSLFWLLSMVY